MSNQSIISIILFPFAKEYTTHSIPINCTYTLVIGKFRFSNTVFEIVGTFIIKLSKPIEATINII